METIETKTETTTGTTTETKNTSVIKPIFLLADSQILFWRAAGDSFMERIRRLMEEGRNPDTLLSAAYIGASNEDNPEFYTIFEAAMAQVEIPNCRMIPSEPGEEDLDFLASANLILLAGGDIQKGWTVIEDKFREIIVQRYYDGAVLVGISAGAVQLGNRGWKEAESMDDALFDTFQLVPALIDVHREESDWDHLRQMVEHLGPYNRGYGIPSGGAAAYHPDWTFEAVRHHLVEFSHIKDDNETPRFKRSMILPSESHPAQLTEPVDEGAGA